MSEVDITSDGVTVWVNNDVGYCLGRFGKMGIDIHSNPKSVKEMQQCILCTHEQTTLGDGHRFIEGMRQHHNITVPDEYRPTRFRGP